MGPVSHRHILAIPPRHRQRWKWLIRLSAILSVRRQTRETAPLLQPYRFQSSHSQSILSPYSFLSWEHFFRPDRGGAPTPWGGGAFSFSSWWNCLYPVIGSSYNKNELVHLKRCSQAWNFASDILNGCRQITFLSKKKLSEIGLLTPKTAHAKTLSWWVWTNERHYFALQESTVKLFQG